MTTPRIFFNFSPNFYRWPPYIMRAVLEQAPEASFTGIASGGRHVIDALQEGAKGLPLTPVHDLDQLETKWLKTPYQKDTLAAFEQKLGGNVVNEILVADRMVGYGYITGGLIPETPLMRLCRENPDRHRRYLAGLLGFLFDLFENDKPDLVFSYAVAGSVARSLAAMCRHFDVPFCRINELRFQKYAIVDTSPTMMADPVAALYQNAQNDPSVVQDNLALAKERVSTFRSAPFLPDYVRISRQNMRLPPLRDMAALLWRAATFRPPEVKIYPYHLSRFFWEIKRVLGGRRLLKSRMFTKFASLKDTDFAYYPLHFDPEATTMVLAPMLMNQLSVIENISKSIPADWQLAVKDHYVMLGRRPLWFYKRLKQIPKVTLVATEENSHDLIKAARLTCVITGTAAWEAMLFQKPVLCLGKAHYQNVGEGFVLCPNIADLPEYVQKALAQKPASDDALALYIASMMTAGFEMSSDLLNNMDLTDTIVKQQQSATNAVANRILEECR